MKRIKQVKSMMAVQAAIAILASLSLASCGGDDDDKISKTQIQQTLFEMKNAYHGQLQFGLKEQPNDRTKLEGSTVFSARGLMLDIPLDPIADQVADKTLSDKIRAVGTARVYADYEFLQIDKYAASFVLVPRMLADNRTTALTRTTPFSYPGLMLLFSENYGGDFFAGGSGFGSSGNSGYGSSGNSGYGSSGNSDYRSSGNSGGESSSQGSWIDFNLCVESVLIDNIPLDGFRPVFYRYEGSAESPKG